MARVKASDVKPCMVCGGSIAIHYRVSIKQMIVDQRSVQQFRGLTQFFGGHAHLADVMGAGIEMKEFGKWDVIVCNECIHESLIVIMGHDEKEPT